MTRGCQSPRWPVTASAATSAHCRARLGDASPKAHRQEGGSCENTAPIPPNITTFTKWHTTSNRCFATRCRSHHKCPRRIQGISAPVHHLLGKHQSLKEPVSHEGLEQHFSFQLVTISKRYWGKNKKGRCCRRRKINSARKKEGEGERWETKKRKEGSCTLSTAIKATLSSPN